MKFYVDCVGCEQRQLDAQRIINYFERNGNEMVGSPEQSDYSIFVTCGVDVSAKNASLRRLSEIYENVDDPSRILLSGCLPDISPKEIQKYGNFPSISSRHLEEFDIYFSDHISVPMNKIYHPNSSIFDYREDPTGLLDKLTPRGEYDLAKNGFKIRVNNGCLMNCSYCVIKNAMGRVASVPLDNLIEQFHKAVDNGEPTIMIMGGDTGAYGYDIGIRFYTLLDNVLEIPGSHRVFIHDFNVNWYLRDSVIYNEIFSKNESHRRLKGANLPIQSGSDRILKLMKRPYKREDVVNILGNAKKRYPSLRIGTHVIVGFPTETEKDFDNTVELLDEVGFDFVSCFVYSEHESANSALLEGKINPEIALKRVDKISYHFGDKVRIFR